MDSKYNAISQQQQNSPFNFKRKLTNGNLNANNDQFKRFRPNNGNVEYPKGNNLSAAGQNGNGKGLTIEEQRHQLPVYKVRKQLLNKIMSSKTLIVIGETGCGKTTQIPQIIYESTKPDFGTIAITQPRRVAAITISKRVALEQKCTIGETVGYTVRFEDATSIKTKIKYMTDGSLLREALADKFLRKYRVIILDEAHERTINTDVLFGIVKDAQRLRAEKALPSLKIIVMSATMDVDHFSKYFNNCEPIYLAGRTYPVKVLHSAEPQSDYLNACLVTLFQIHKTVPVNHDVLIFLTGQEEIENMAAQIRSIVKSNEIGGPMIRVFPLYAQMNQNKQLEVFQPSTNNYRKVILSTNIAETSLTIKGIKYVIDSGMVKRKVYDSVTGMDTLKVTRISQDQAWQRTGRAGRESEGFCYRAYTMNEYRIMSAASMPEILRSNISATVLQLLALGINCRKFDFLDKPSDQDIESALKQLYQLGAITSHNGDELTTLGWNMSKFPLDPRFSKILLSASDFGCLDEMLSIVSILSGETIFYLSDDPDKKVEALKAHAKFESIHGDHLTLLNVYNEFKKTDRHRTFCHDNYLNYRNLEYAHEVRRQLSDICERLQLEPSSCGSNLDQVRKCLISGLYNNIAEMQRDHSFMTISSRQKTKIHPSSVLNSKTNLKCILFTELVQTSLNFMRIVTIIDPEWIEEVVPNCGVLGRLSHCN
ncbi:hypothetical protein HA402_014465 [Bradysia odoriphaga]|nr:hypothetical protein HA402_014465 [Bradysia odoriphaga]